METSVKMKTFQEKDEIFRSSSSYSTKISDHQWVVIESDAVLKNAKLDIKITMFF